MQETEIDIFSVKLPAYIENVADQGNTLTILIQEATGLGPEEEQTISSIDLGVAREIVPNGSDRLLEISWENYVGFSVLNESYANVDEANQNHERKYKFAVGQPSAGWFVEYMRQAAFADDNYPGPLKYWEVVGNDHVVHIWSNVEPKVRLMTPTTITTH